MRPPSAGLDPRLRSPADQMAAALRAAGPLGASPSPSPFGLPPGLAPPASLASSAAGMDAILAQRYHKFSDFFSAKIISTLEQNVYYYMLTSMDNIFYRALLERDHALRAAHDSQLFAAAHAQQLQQQEEALKRLTRP